MPSPAACHLVYCEGWDPLAARPVGLLEPDTARERDEAGEQYAVLVRDPGGEPLVLLEIAWSHDHCGVWLFDADGERRTHHRYARREDGALALTHSRRWPEPAAEEADEEGRLVLTTAVLMGPEWASYHHDYLGGGRTTVNRWPDEDLVSIATRPAPGFGRWEELLALHPRLSDATVRLSEADVEPDPVPVTAPWSPPGPLAPVGVDELFRPGGEHRDARWKKEAEIEVHDAGTVTLPTGRVLVFDPSRLDTITEEQALSVPLPPGEHPVRLSVLRSAAPDREFALVAGVRIDVADLAGTPVDSWEMALSPGQDFHILGEGQFFGVLVDGGSGVVSLCDAACLPRLRELFSDPERDHNLLIGHTEEELARFADRERRMREAARAFLDEPGARTAQHFAGTVGDSMGGEAHTRSGVWLLRRLAHAIVHTEVPGPLTSTDPRERAEDTSPWSRTLDEPVSGGNMVTVPAGYGADPCPMWLGRTADGRVAALVVDTRVIDRPTEV
ncbi:DUF4241 domain-containing protein [Nocardiopsis sp. FIRDI 009]|uniref:DUF4241 domain-containing protein n=1 Tax=Nocardiopsis sp. FIRDI 009 TaxID=714197 RepID=UPI000E273651|nr:DUF4241 domain-containing protein [Nocardiopsis sp. FIRDI 009]